MLGIALVFVVGMAVGYAIRAAIPRSPPSGFKTVAWPPAMSREWLRLFAVIAGGIGCWISMVLIVMRLWGVE